MQIRHCGKLDIYCISIRGMIQLFQMSFYEESLKCLRLFDILTDLSFAWKSRPLKLVQTKDSIECDPYGELSKFNVHISLMDPIKINIYKPWINNFIYHIYEMLLYIRTLTSTAV